MRVSCLNISLDNAVVLPKDGTNVRLQLSESERARALEISGVSGGNDDAVLLDIDAGAFTDIGQVLNIEQLGVTVNEGECVGASHLVTRLKDLGRLWMAMSLILQT